jgi:agmatinase
VSLSKYPEYDPSGVGVKGSLFGLPFKKNDASIVILPVPWDATSSYHDGSALGPKAVLDASSQLDLEVPNETTPWKKGIWMSPIESSIHKESSALRKLMMPYRECLEKGLTYEGESELLSLVNQSTENLAAKLKEQCLNLISDDKIIGLLGGDHSCPLGLIQALADTHGEFGILQVDAHMDLRKSYEGFWHSHASIMYNALQLKAVTKLVQVGVRDYCNEEMDLVSSSKGLISTYFDQNIKKECFEGRTWQSICDEIIDELPQKVYVSFDIDGLNPHLCPGTGTPVPGGLEFSESIYLLEKLKQSGKTVIGFDLCEVAPQPNDLDWNANVGARLLYALCGVV